MNTPVHNVREYVLKNATVKNVHIHIVGAFTCIPQQKSVRRPTKAQTGCLLGTWACRAVNHVTSHEPFVAARFRYHGFQHFVHFRKTRL